MIVDLRHTLGSQPYERHKVEKALAIVERKPDDYFLTEVGQEKARDLIIPRLQAWLLNPNNK